jgi:hypothetical protein
MGRRERNDCSVELVRKATGWRLKAAGEDLSVHREVSTRQAAWHIKATPIFAAALTLVHSHVWQHAHFSLSDKDYELGQIPRPLFGCLTDTLCYTA